MSRSPEILWAQRSDKVYLTVALPDAKDVSVKCEPQGLFKFSATRRQGEKYDCVLELYGTIVPETKAGLRNILCSVKKEQKGWWKRLLKSDKKSAPHLKVDWSKWCDEDDEESDYDSDTEDETAAIMMMKRATMTMDYFIFQTWRKLEETEPSSLVPKSLNYAQFAETRPPSSTARLSPPEVTPVNFSSLTWSGTKFLTLDIETV